MSKQIKSIINEKNINDADVVILSAPYDKTASSHKGAVNGPKAIINCLDSQIEFFSKKYKVNVNDFVKVANQNLGNLNSLSPEKTFKKINESAKKLLTKNKFIFLLGGEHAVSYGVFDALSTKYNPKEITILQIDAHCDLREDDGDYSKRPTRYAHSAVMRRASELSYNIVQVGIRTYCKEEYEYFSNKKNNIEVFEWKNQKERPKIEDIINSIKTKYLYISIDVDGFDPSVMPGTGTPVPGGIKWSYGAELIKKAILEKELIGADIVEAIPQKGNVLTEYSSAQLFYYIITEKFRSRYS